MPREPNEYHLIDLATGLSCGGFKSLAAALTVIDTRRR
jgi:hypothetical protein